MIAERTEIKETSTAVAVAPVEIYRERAARFKGDFERQTERWNRIGNLRLLTFLGAAVATVWGVWVGLRHYGWWGLGCFWASSCWFGITTGWGG